MKPDEVTNCEEHDRKITELDTTVRNGKYIFGVGLTIAMFAFTFVMGVIGWVINDNLSGIRAELKDFKTIAMETKEKADRNATRMEYLEAWKITVDDHLKLKR